MAVIVVTETVPYRVPDNISQYRIPGIRFRIYGPSTGWDALVAMIPMAHYRASRFPMIVFLPSPGGRHYSDTGNKK
jgi:hypothetical protein